MTDVKINRKEIIQQLSEILPEKVVNEYLNKIEKGTLKVDYAKARNNSISGQHDASWLGYYHFLNKEMDVVDETKKLEGLWKLAEVAHWTQVYDSVCIVSHKPTELYVDDLNRLHNEHGPAFNFSDDWKEYFLCNIPVDAKFIETPELVTPDEIINFSNQEVRRVLMRKFGEDKILKALNAELIDSDGWGDLYKTRLPNSREDFVMVHMINTTPDLDGSRKDYYSRVHPSITKVVDAMKWLAGMELDQEYAPVAEA